MKCSNKIKLVLLFNLLLLRVAAQNNITIRYAVTGGDYQEIQVSKNQNSAYIPETKKEDKLYRFFSPNQDHQVFSAQIIKRHENLYKEFREAFKGDDVTQANFSNYAKTHDSYYYSAMGYLAPVIKFDFSGANQQYVLDTIEVNVISFEEYRGEGGGFFKDEAFYDILLPHAGGTVFLPVEKKLEFIGTGSANLRFWSDNFYKVVGFCPTGCYTINVVFHFISGTRKMVVASGVFKIDV